jgi:hypothetical protein
MIDGLKLTMTGEAIKQRLTDRIQQHAALVERYTKEREQGDPAGRLRRVAERAYEYEIEQHTESIQTLTLIRDHVLDGETYLLGRRDLEFAEILRESDC